MKPSVKILHWTPRILGILAILFVSLFALDSFDNKLSFWKQISGFIIHLVPSFILLVFLLFSWKKELIGGIIFVLIGVGFSPFIYKHNFAMNHSVSTSLLILLTITFPFILMGILFIISHFIKKKQHKIKK